MTSATNPKTIELSGSFTQYEALAGGSVTPGYLVTRNSDGKIIAHATAGGATEAAFATEAAYIGGGIDDVYEEGDIVRYVVGSAGARVYAFIDTSQNITAGGLLESAGNGTFRALGSGVAIARALESVNAVGAPARIRVEVL